MREDLRHGLVALSLVVVGAAIYEALLFQWGRHYRAILANELAYQGGTYE